MQLWLVAVLACGIVGTHAGRYDLAPNKEMLKNDLFLEEKEFAPGSCEILEGCVGGPGLRRLLRFSAGVMNVGDKDFVVGNPAAPSNAAFFEYSQCHNHYHFKSLTEFSLFQVKKKKKNKKKCKELSRRRRRKSKACDKVVKRVRVMHSRKQAFCMQDSVPIDRTNWDPYAQRDRTFDCGHQGISAQWEDVYGAFLPCQWVDVTGLDDGIYTLRLEINPDGILDEPRDNNVAEIDVEIKGNRAKAI